MLDFRRDSVTRQFKYFSNTPIKCRFVLRPGKFPHDLLVRYGLFGLISAIYTPPKTTPPRAFTRGSSLAGCAARRRTRASHNIFTLQFLRASLWAQLQDINGSNAGQTRPWPLPCQRLLSRKCIARKPSIRTAAFRNWLVLLRTRSESLDSPGRYKLLRRSYWSL